MAGGNNRDVNLVIQARNEATKAIDSVSASLEALKKVQAEVTSGAQRTDGVLGELSSEFANLTNQAKGLQALSTVATVLDKASAAVERLQGQVERTTGEAAGLGERYTEAAKATGELAQRAEQAQASLADEQRRLTELREAQAALNAEIKASQSAFSEARTAVVRAKAPSDELKQAYRDQLGALQALYTAQERSVAGVRAQVGAVETAKNAVKDLQTQVGAAVEAETALERASEKSAAALGRQKENLDKAAAELSTITTIAAEASTALGGVAATQDAVSAAAQRTATDLEKVREALSKQNAVATGQGSTQPGSAASATQAYRDQVAAVQQAREAFAAARAEATRLGAEFARTVAPSRELQTAFTLARAAADQAELAYVSQADALNRLRGVTQGSVTAFLEIAAADEAQVRGAHAAALAEEELANALPPIAPRAEQAATAFRNLLGVLFQVPEAAGAAEGALARTGNSSREALGIFERMRSEILSLTTAYVGFFGAIQAVEGVVKTFTNLQSAQQRLSVAFEGDTRAVGVEIGFVREEANRLGYAFNELLNNYTKTSIAAKEQGYSTEGTRKIFIAFAEAARISGLSSQELERVTKGLFESIDKGTINARNFSNQIGQVIPGANAAMAEALGVSTTKFYQLQRAAGGIAATEPLLTKFADVLTKRLGGGLDEATNSLASNLNRLKTDIQQAEVDVAKGGFADALIGVLHQLDAAFKDGSADTFFKQIGQGLGGLLQIVPAIAANFGLLVKALQVFVGLKVASFILDIARNGTLFGVSMTVASADVDRLSAAVVRLQGFKLSTFFTQVRTSAAAAGATLATMNLETAALATGEALAAAGSVALSGAITALRGVMVVAAATARAMWTAIGGFPGLLITGLTFVITELLGKWVGGIETATSAMDAHEKILDQVRQAYTEAGDDAVKLKEHLKDISAIKVQANSDTLAQQLRDARAAPVQVKGDARDLLGQEVGKQLTAARQAFRDGQISAEAYRQKIEAIGQEHANQGPRVRALIVTFLEQAEAAAKVEVKLKENAAALRVQAGTATDADRAILGLAKSVKELNGALSPQALDQFNEGLDKLRKLNPLQKTSQKVQEARDEALRTLKSNLSVEGFNDDQARQVAEGHLNVAGVTLQQAEIAKQAYDTYIKTIKGISLDYEHKLAAAIPTDNSNLLARINRAEGSGKNPRSSASGIGQFVDGTYLHYFDQVFDKILDVFTTRASKLATKSDTTYARPIQDAYLKDIQVALGKAGIAINNATSYAGYIFGPSGGIRLLQAAKDVVATSVASAAAVKANPELFFNRGANGKIDRSSPRTAGQLRQEIARRVGGGAPIQSNGLTQPEEAAEGLKLFLAGLKEDTDAVEQNAREVFISSKIREQERAFASKNTVLSDPQRQQIRDSAGADFDAKQAAENQKKLEEAIAETRLANSNKVKSSTEALSREEYILAEARKKNVQLTGAAGDELRNQLGRQYDLGQQQRGYDNVIGASQQRTTLAGQLQDAFKQGDVDKVKELQEQITDVTRKIQENLPAAKAWAAALGDQKMSAQLQKVESGLQRVKTQLVDTKQINNLLADGLTRAFSTAADAMGKFVTGTGKLKDVFAAAGQAFLQFAGDFLKQIAEMIIKQQLLQLLAKSPIGDFISSATNKLAGVAAAQGNVAMSAAEGGAAAAASTAAIPIVGPELALEAGAAMEAAILGTFGAQVAAGLLHAGGVVGQPGGQSRSGVLPMIFANAARYHAGGIAGLKPNEVPTILERGEEVLTRSDARHALNGGGRGDSASGNGGMSNLKIVNAVDGTDALQKALQSDVGQRVLLNHVKANPAAFKAAMGVK